VHEQFCDFATSTCEPNGWTLCKTFTSGELVRTREECQPWLQPDAGVGAERMTPHFHSCRTIFRIQLAQIAGTRIVSEWRASHTRPREPYLITRPFPRRGISLQCRGWNSRLE